MPDDHAVPRGRQYIARLAGFGTVGLAAALATAPTAHATATSADSTSTTSADLGAFAASGPSTAVKSLLQPEYGFQKIRVGIQTKDGGYYPPDASLAGATIKAVATAQDGTQRTETCTTDTTGECDFHGEGDSEDGLFTAGLGETVVFTQLSAPTGPGIVVDPRTRTVEPCARDEGSNFCNGTVHTLLAPPVGQLQNPQGGPIVAFTDPGVAPTATDDTATSAGGPVTISVLANDQPAGAPASVGSVTDPAHGTAKISGDSVMYTPDAGYSGSDAFQYTIKTANGSATATVTLTVTAPRSTPSSSAAASSSSPATATTAGPAPTSTPSSTQPVLAETGSSSGHGLALGGGLLALGGGLLLAGRRRVNRGRRA